LIGQAFKADNIRELLDENATVSNIMKEFDGLLANIKPGDIVYFHYSGHGQQIADLRKSDYPKLKYIEKDEDDGYDEALALYNAPIEYFDGYDFSEHLIDDQLDYYVSTLESKLGKEGHVVVVLDEAYNEYLEPAQRFAQVEVRGGRRGIDLHHVRQWLHRLAPLGASTGEDPLKQEHLGVTRAEFGRSLEFGLGIVKAKPASEDRRARAPQRNAIRPGLD
jgi:hypothetical protein